MTVETSVPRSRRSMLAAAAAGVGAMIAAALGRPIATRAAGGDPLILGQVNDAGTSQTILNNAGLGASLTSKTTGLGSGATGIFGWSSSTAAHPTRGVYGRAEGKNSYGVDARNSASSTGTGAAIRAAGDQNIGVDAFSFNSTAVRCTSEFGIGVVGSSFAFHGVFGNSGTSIGVYGLSNSYYGVLGASNSGYAGGFEGPVRITKYIDVHEMTAPANPAGNTARLFVRDNAGKTELCVIFPTGLVQVITTEA